jgi:hypothetical protein
MTVTEALETIVEARAKNLPVSALAEVLDRLMWCMDDNGHTIVQLQLQWLKENDEYRAGIALTMSEAFPFSNMQEARDALGALQERWPHHGAACSSFLEKWQKELREH